MSSDSSPGRPQIQRRPGKRSCSGRDRKWHSAEVLTPDRSLVIGSTVGATAAETLAVRLDFRSAVLSPDALVVRIEGRDLEPDSQVLAPLTVQLFEWQTRQWLRIGGVRLDSVDQILEIEAPAPVSSFLRADGAIRLRVSARRNGGPVTLALDEAVVETLSATADDDVSP